MIKYLFYLLPFSSVLGQTADEDKKIMENAPIAGNVVCGNHLVEEYNTFITSYNDSSVITYRVKNYPSLLRPSYVDSTIHNVAQKWSEAIGKKIVQIFDTCKEPNINISFEYLDGIGGTLGIAEYPPSSKGVGSRMMQIDKYDIQPNSAGMLSDKESIELHEFGHALGFRHSDKHDAVLWWQYNGRKRDLTLDDYLVAKLVYQDRRSFSIGNHKYFYLENTKKKIGKYFTAREFYPQCQSAKDLWLDTLVVLAMDEIRKEYGRTKTISTVRDPSCNKSAGGSIQSMHLSNCAVDFTIVSKRESERYRRDIITKGPMFKKLLTMGIKGFGLYAGSFHIDSRDNGNKYFGGISYSFWNGRNWSTLGGDEPTEDVNEADILSRIHP